MNKGIRIKGIKAPAEVWLCIFVALLSVVILGIDDRLFYADDDDDYFAVSTSIAFGQFPSFAKEYHVGERMPYASVGPGVLASPFVFIFSLVDRILGKPICKKREEDNRYWTWTLLGFDIAVYVYFLCGCFLLFHHLKLWVPELSAFATVVFLVTAGGGILIYVFRRPVMSHVFEFATISACLYLISLVLQGRRLLAHDLLIGAVASFVFLCRYNNFFLALAFVGVYLWLVGGLRERDFSAIIRCSIAFIMPILIFRLLPVLINGYSANDQYYMGGLSLAIVPESDVFFYVRRLGEIVFGEDMGLIFTGPAIVVGLLCAIVYRKRGPKLFIFLLCVSMVNLYFAANWKSFGSYYGYRYIAFTAGPLLSLYLAFWTEVLRKKWSMIAVVALFSAISYLPLYSLMSFNRVFSLELMTNSYGVDTYGNPKYHLEVLTALLRYPLSPLIKGWGAGLGKLLTADHWSEVGVQRLVLLTAPPLIALAILFVFSSMKALRS